MLGLLLHDRPAHPHPQNEALFFCVRRSELCTPLRAQLELDCLFVHLGLRPPPLVPNNNNNNKKTKNPADIDQ